jgi:hypothetical protein
MLLPLPKQGLTSAPWSAQGEPRRGVIVIAPVPGKDVSETGVVSVDHSFAMTVDPGYVQLAVAMRDASVTVISTAKDLERYGKLIRGSIHEGDVITHVDGKACSDLAAYDAETRRETFIGGEFVRLSVRRDGVTSEVALPIEATTNGITYLDYADVSLRTSGFPSVFSHDTIVPRRQCADRWSIWTDALSE